SMRRAPVSRRDGSAIEEEPALASIRSLDGPPSSVGGPCCMLLSVPAGSCNPLGGLGGLGGGRSHPDGALGLLPLCETWLLHSLVLSASRLHSPYLSGVGRSRPLRLRRHGCLLHRRLCELRLGGPSSRLVERVVDLAR